MLSTLSAEKTSLADAIRSAAMYALVDELLLVVPAKFALLACLLAVGLSVSLEGEGSPSFPRKDLRLQRQKMKAKISKWLNIDWIMHFKPYSHDLLSSPCTLTDENSDAVKGSGRESSDAWSNKDGGIATSFACREWDPLPKAIPIATNKRIFAHCPIGMMSAHYAFLTSDCGNLMAQLIRFLSLLGFIAWNGTMKRNIANC
jgi:hypothetical protein